ncbi:MAG: flagellar operon protein [Sporolactobacillus sp.]|jgi:flagellar operon protein|nr:flagellar operon protein [Sporolactobacillus sp.]MCI1882359.1 flagellar operon protein [Sporolactobacillus sp.]
MDEVGWVPAYPAGHADRPIKRQSAPPENRPTFRSVLNDRLQNPSIKLTKHAKERLQSRNIRLSGSEWQQIGRKLREAEKMGVHDSLVLTRHAALVVNAPKNTVITAMNLQEAHTHIFTNINGTIVIDHD